MILNKCQVVVVVASEDRAKQEGLSIAKVFAECTVLVAEGIRVPSLFGPPSFLKLELALGMKPRYPKSVLAPLKKEILDLWSGVKLISKSCGEAGFDTDNKEVFNSAGDLVEFADMLRLDVIEEVETKVASGTVFGVWEGPPCKTMGFFG